MNEKEHNINKGLDDIVKSAKDHEKDGRYDRAASEYKRARKFFKEIGNNKLYAQCLVAHAVNMIKFYLAVRDIEEFSTNPFDPYIGKIDGIMCIELSKLDKYDISIAAYRELEKVFQDSHMVDKANEMYYKKTGLYHIRHWHKAWQRTSQKDRKYKPAKPEPKSLKEIFCHKMKRFYDRVIKFLKRVRDFLYSILDFLLHIFCGHGEKPWRAVSWILVYIILFSFFFKCFDLIEFTDPEKTGCFGQSLYFSVVTITTLGYGDIVPRDWRGEVFIVIEVIGGLLMFGLLIATIFRKMTK
jgi:hypothetical protein